MTQEYIHGFSREEQERLIRQAEFLKPYIYEKIQMTNVNHLLEVGCGVGAQTKILLEIFPHLKITGVDLSKDQLAVAEKRLKKYIDEGRLKLIEADASKLNILDDESFDGAFLCWFLEHVPKPVAVLKEVKNKLKPGSPLWSTEVMNWTLFVEPYSPNLLKYWFEFNDYQWSLKGNPFIGAQMGNYLTEANYSKVKTDVRTWFWDDRYPVQRKDFFDELRDLLYSAADGLKAEGRVDQKLIDGMKQEMDERSVGQGSVLYMSWMRSEALA
ncbi:MAG: methyltransferase domain-containing protein [Bdellovibrionales bacterium]|nr:methyltransferase domain-containing protein [Bdellovibrionales bacterium]